MNASSVSNVSVFLAVLGLAFFAGLGTAEATEKTYQVTGPIVEITDNSIVVQKGTEKWELAKTPSTETKGELKKGQKVTIQYSMTALSIETKDESQAKKTKKK